VVISRPIPWDALIESIDPERPTSPQKKWGTQQQRQLTDSCGGSPRGLDEVVKETALDLNAETRNVRSPPILPEAADFLQNFRPSA
jgi:hypothetical protein